MAAKISGLLCYLVLAAVWYLPLYRMHRRTVSENPKYYVFTLILGMISTVPVLACQQGISLLISKYTDVTSLSASSVKAVYGVLYILITIGLCEEMFKFLLGRISVKRVPDLTEAGSMLILGMAGLGFGIMETLNCSSIWDGLLRGVLNMHIFLQLWMGRYIWKAWNAKKQNDGKGYRRNVLLALGVPVLVHFIFDYCLMKGPSLLTQEKTAAGMVTMAIAFIAGIVFIVIVRKMAKRLLKEEASHPQSLPDSSLPPKN